MAFNKGHRPWNKGKTNVYSKQTIERFQEIARNRKYSKETRKKLSMAKLGKKQSKSHIKNKALANVGKHNYSEETRRLIAINTQRGMGVDGIHQMRATKAGFKDWKEYLKMHPKWKQYKSKVWSITRQSLKDNPALKNFEKRGRCGVIGAYQVDHIISVREGFDKNIAPNKIGAYSNLRMLPWKENLLKG